MKIYKVAQFTMIHQNPNSPPNLDAQLVNLQNSQAALNDLGNIANKANEIYANINELQDALGDTSLKNAFENGVKTAIQNTPAFQLLTHMNLVTSVDNLLNPNFVSQTTNNILKSIQDGKAEQAKAGKVQ